MFCLPVMRVFADMFLVSRIFENIFKVLALGFNRQVIGLGLALGT